MRDAIGGSVVITIIVFFIVVVSAYMAFNVNYNKAFRMKDKIIAVYEEYKGECETNTACQKKISDYAKSVGYKPAKLNCKDGYSSIDELYCVKEVDGTIRSSGAYEGESLNSYYYKIQTKIDIRIPIIDNLMGLKVFTITGDTKVFVK